MLQFVSTESSRLNDLLIRAAGKVGAGRGIGFYFPTI